MTFSGGCLCGAVRYSGQKIIAAGHCHCLDCRKTSGTGRRSHMMVSEAGFEVSGELRFFVLPADSGNRIGRGFCPTCGSQVYSTNSGMPGMVAVNASSLDDLEVFKPQMTVYAKRAASWDPVDPKLPAFKGMPPEEEVQAALALIEP